MWANQQNEQKQLSTSMSTWGEHKQSISTGVNESSKNMIIMQSWWLYCNDRCSTTRIKWTQVQKGWVVLDTERQNVDTYVQWQVKAIINLCTHRTTYSIQEVTLIKWLRSKQYNSLMINQMKAMKTCENLRFTMTKFSSRSDIDLHILSLQKMDTDISRMANLPWVALQFVTFFPRKYFCNY